MRSNRIYSLDMDRSTRGHWRRMASHARGAIEFATIPTRLCVSDRLFAVRAVRP
jgi:hypothetical protein